MLKVAIGHTLSYLIAGWFMAVLALIVCSGIGFLATLAYFLIF